MQKPKMTANLYNAVKTLRECGSSIAEIADTLKLSKATVSRVFASENLDDYFHNLRVNRAIHAAKKKEQELEPEKEPEPKVVEHRQSITIQATHFMYQEQQRTNETLELISRKLTAIMETMDKLLKVWENN